MYDQRSTIKLYDNRKAFFQPAESHNLPNTEHKKTRLFHLYLLGVIDPLKVNKGEPSGAPSALVINHVNTGQRSVSGEHISQVALCGVQAQAKHPQTRVRVRVSLEGKDKGDQGRSSKKLIATCNYTETSFSM